MSTPRDTDAAAAVRVPRVLPRGTNRLPRDIVLLSQRGRIVEATSRVVAEKGYAAMTLSDICRVAGVSRSTFYEQFADKEACFLACYTEGAETHFEAVAAAIAAADTLATELLSAVESYIDLLIVEPDYARAFYVEAMSAGPAAIERRAVYQQRYLDRLVDWHRRVREARPKLPEVPVASWDLVARGVADSIADELRSGGDLKPLLVPILHVYLSVAGLDRLAAAVLRDGPDALAAARI